MHADDEIDLRDLIISIWDGRWFISQFILAFALLGILLVFITSDRFRSEIEITPLSASRFDAYRELNKLDFIPISRGSLLTRFMEKIENGDINYDAFRQAVEPGEMTPEEIEELVIAQVKNLEVENITDPEQEGAQTTYRLSYTGSDAEGFRMIIEQILSTANSQVWSDLNRLFSQEINILETNRAYELETLENSIESRRVLYHKNLVARLAFLKEQSTIAHTLGIERSVISGEMVPLGGASLATIEKDTPEYFRGYEAIDKEIELLSSRQNDEAFIPGVPELKMKIDQIQRDNRLERIKLALERSPLSNQADFIAATYDLNKMEVESTLKPPLVLALALILGLMTGVLALGVRNALRKADLTAR